MAFETGSAFRFHVPGAHVWTIISDTQQSTSEVLMVSVTTLRGTKDDSCILRPGDHSCVAHDSCVMYRKAMIVSVAELESALAHEIIHEEPFGPDVVARMGEGAQETDQLSNRARQLLRQQGLID